MLPMTATYSTVSGPHWQESRNLSTALTHPNGNITVEVILFVNVSLSFGWTKSIKLRPCHISFGNPKTSVIEVVVCNTIPSLRLTAAQKPPIPVDNCSLSKTSVIWYLVASPAQPRNIYLRKFKLLAGSLLEVIRQNIAGWCLQTFCFQKFVDNTQQGFASIP